MKCECNELVECETLLAFRVKKESGLLFANELKWKKRLLFAGRWSAI